MSAAKVPISGGPFFSAPSIKGGDKDRHSHVVQFYIEDESLVERMTQFIGTALGAGDAAVVIATKAHRDALTKRLGAPGLDTRAIEGEGRLVLLDADETLSKFLLEGWPDPDRFAEVIGEVIILARAAAKTSDRRVSAFGEMVSSLWAQGKNEAAIQLEQLWGELIKKHSISLLCAYPMAYFDRDAYTEPFLRICASHSGVIPDESYTVLGSQEEQLRTVTSLQQRAQTVENEKADRLQAQKVLKLRESELADLLENSLEGVQRAGFDQRIVWANKAILRLLGYSPEEYIGHQLSEFYVHKNVLDEFWAKLMRGEEIYDFPAELRCKDGSIKHVLIHSNGLWENGQFVHTRTFIRDITERREMEMALKQAHDELEQRVNERTAELSQKSLEVQKQAEVLQLTNQGLRDLSARLVEVQDEERRRIARDLRDSTGQSLALLSMNLSALERRMPKK